MPDRLVGIYPAIGILPMLGGVRFEISNSGGAGGLARLPHGPPTGSNEISYTRLWRDWYVWQCDWSPCFEEIVFLYRAR